jgi:hypothetical protein
MIRWAMIDNVCRILTGANTQFCRDVIPGNWQITR